MKTFVSLYLVVKPGGTFSAAARLQEGGYSNLVFLTIGGEGFQFKDGEVMYRLSLEGNLANGYLLKLSDNVSHAMQEIKAPTKSGQYLLIAQIGQNGFFGATALSIYSIQKLMQCQSPLIALFVSGASFVSVIDGNQDFPEVSGCSVFDGGDASNPFRIYESEPVSNEGGGGLQSLAPRVVIRDCDGGLQGLIKNSGVAFTIDVGTRRAIEAICRRLTGVSWDDEAETQNGTFCLAYLASLANPTKQGITAFLKQFVSLEPDDDKKSGPFEICFAGQRLSALDLLSLYLGEKKIGDKPFADSPVLWHFGVVAFGDIEVAPGGTSCNAFKEFVLALLQLFNDRARELFAVVSAFREGNLNANSMLIAYLKAYYDVYLIVPVGCSSPEQVRNVVYYPANDEPTFSCQDLRANCLLPPEVEILISSHCVSYPFMRNLLFASFGQRIFAVDLYPMQSIGNQTKISGNHSHQSVRNHDFEFYGLYRDLQMAVADGLDDLRYASGGVVVDGKLMWNPLVEVFGLFVVGNCEEEGEGVHQFIYAFYPSGETESFEPLFAKKRTSANGQESVATYYFRRSVGEGLSTS